MVELYENRIAHLEELITSMASKPVPPINISVSYPEQSEQVVEEPVQPVRVDEVSPLVVDSTFDSLPYDEAEDLVIAEMSGLSLVKGQVVESTNTNTARYEKQARRQAAREEKQAIRQAAREEKLAHQIEVEQLRLEEKQILAEQKAAEEAVVKNYKELRKQEILTALNELDLKSIRALRANETEYIQRYEEEATALREELKNL